jgi:hypothetical protein
MQARRRAGAQVLTSHACRLLKAARWRHFTARPKNQPHVFHCHPPTCVCFPGDVQVCVAGGANYTTNSRTGHCVNNSALTPEAIIVPRSFGERIVILQPPDRLVNNSAEPSSSSSAAEDTAAASSAVAPAGTRGRAKLLPAGLAIGNGDAMASLANVSAGGDKPSIAEFFQLNALETVRQGGKQVR